jgi:alpha-mannosidase
LEGQAAPGGGQWLQLPGIDGIDALLLRQGSGAGATPLPISDPVYVETAPDLGPGRWRLGNGLLSAAIGPQGVEQLWDSSGVRHLAGCLQWRRWRDRGEYWDAWDIASDHRDHPLAWHWHGEPQWIERGPLCARFLWRGQCGGSRVRLDGRLLAGTPWLELTLSLEWRQRHELLRLEIPLADPAARWAADTSGGVIERPAVARTARERERWEVPVISWLASVSDTDGRGSGLAVLLDGPQGVSGTAEQLGVSLLRAPTWPDPGADNGWQRQRLALLPAPGGWRAAQVPRHAQRLREPLWVHPAPHPLLSPAAPENPWRPSEALPGGGLERPIPALASDLRLVSLRALINGELVVAIQNEGPCRQHLNLGPAWQSLERLDGLDRAARGWGAEDSEPWLRPWELVFWRLRGRSELQSS